MSNIIYRFQEKIFALKSDVTSITRKDQEIGVSLNEVRSLVRIGCLRFTTKDN